MAAWPLAASPQTVRAQKAAMPVVGFLETGSAGPVAHLLDSFRKGLAETGYVEGQNVAVEYRFADGDADRLPALVTELVRRQIAVIVTPGSMPGAQAATTT